MEQILTVLAGQPNCGKSTIFNMLTGARQYVANYPGVTVEKKAGSFVCGDTRVELVDLPGTYSLASWSPEEMAARQFIVEEDPAQIVAVLDASTLEKSLYLCLQLLEMRRPTLAVLNMMDVAAKRGIRVDADALSQALGIPVIRAQASKGIGKQELYSAIAARHGRSGSAEIVDYGELETDIREISRLLPRQGVKGYPSRWFAIKLLEQDSLAEGLLASVDTEDGRIAALTRQCRESWATRHGEDMVRSIAHARFAQARDIAARCSERLEFVTSVTEKVDAVLCHRFWGPLILLGILFVFTRPPSRWAIIWPPRSGRSGASWRSGPPPSCRSRAFWKIPS